MMTDDKWDLRFLDMAKLVSAWSKDKTKVGAIIVGEDKQVISQGYNGLPRGIEDDEKLLQNREWKLSRVVHAEHNCIYNAALNGAKLKGSTLYCHGLPVCNECAKGVLQTGISRVVMRYNYKKLQSSEWMKSALISVEMFRQKGIIIKEYQDEMC
jgi:dCMP deaminase